MNKREKIILIKVFCSPLFPGTTLYLGGTGSRPECAAVLGGGEDRELGRLDRAFGRLLRGEGGGESIGGGGIPEVMERDCQCRTWGFQVGWSFEIIKNAF